MGRARVMIAVLLAAALAACAQLTAEAPLFGVDDQAGGPPIAEGVWIAVGEECPERHARGRGRVPIDCTPFQISRDPDGAWRMRLRADLVSGMTAEEREELAQGPQWRSFVLVPATERALAADAYAPLYIVEFRAEPPSQAATYAAIAPLGERPASSMLMLSEIDCAAVLLDGPIEGVTERYREDTNPNDDGGPELETCVAANPGAVRIAVRRAVIEDMETLLGQRFVLTSRRLSP